MIQRFIEAVDKAQEELQYAAYMADCAPNAGLRAIYANKLDWLRWVVMLAKNTLEQEKARCNYK